MFKIFKRYSTYTLIVALLISAISAYYSIVGLTAIFAAAVVPIIIMGAALELGKLVAAVWLKLNWHRAPLSYKMYLVPAVAFLMALTSMGIFGFLSKAHSDQSLISGDSMAKIAIYDEKIKISKDNIDMNRKALKQMDEGVDQLMGRSTDENGAAKAVAIRKSQQKERGRMLAEIEAEQKKITSMNEEAAPLRAENRKIEAEVGPIKYIAALIYGDTADTNVLEKAVRFVIIMIVAVFDPLALVLILAAQQSMRWEKRDEEEEIQKEMNDVEDFFKRAKENARQLDREEAEHIARLTEDIEGDTGDEASGDNQNDVEVDNRTMAEKYPYLTQPFAHFKDTKPIVHKPEPEIKLEYNEDGTMKPLEGEQAYQLLKQVGIFDEDGKLAPEYGGDEPEEEVEVIDPEIQTSNVTIERVMYDPNSQGYINFEGKQTSIESLKTSHPHLILPADGKVPNKFGYGGEFPREALAGDLYMRTDARPHRLFKFNGMEWIHVNKEMNTSYLQSDDYVQHLIDSLNNNQYLPEMLTDDEDEEIRHLLEQ